MTFKIIWHVKLRICSSLCFMFVALCTSCV